MYPLEAVPEPSTLNLPDGLASVLVNYDVDEVAPAEGLRVQQRGGVGQEGPCRQAQVCCLCLLLRPELEQAELEEVNRAFRMRTSGLLLHTFFRANLTL